MTTSEKAFGIVCEYLAREEVRKQENAVACRTLAVIAQSCKRGRDITSDLLASLRLRHVLTKAMTVDVIFRDTPCWDDIAELVHHGAYTSSPAFLYAAAANNKLDAVNAALRCGANPDHVVTMVTGRQMTALMVAAEKGHAEVVSALLANGANPDVKTHGTWTALELAADMNRAEIVNMLLHGGARAGIQDALMDACFRGQGDAAAAVVSLLLDAGADPNVGRFERSPLIAAAIYGNHRIVERLLAAGVDPNLDFGTTALIEAAYQGHAEVISHLVDAGANPNAQSWRRGLTPLECAARMKHPNAVSRLLAAGARPVRCRSTTREIEAMIRAAAAVARPTRKKLFWFL